jgi:TonB family protein
MGASPNPPAGNRFAPYVDELQEFFASACLRFGSPEDIIALTERLEASPSFAEDLGSMIRSIVLREGGSMPHSQILEVVAVAIGGPRMDHAPQLYGQPLRNLLSFMTGVLRKPWNEPPETIVVERAEVLPFPAHPRPAHPRSHGQAAAISAATQRAGRSEADTHVLAEFRQPSDSHPEPAIAPVSHTAAPAPQPEHHHPLPVPDLVGEPTPAETSALDPETPAHEAIENPDHPATDQNAGAVAAVESGEPDHAIAAELPHVADTATTAGIGQNAAASVEPETDRTPAPRAIPAASSGTPSWQAAAKALRTGDEHAVMPPSATTPPDPIPAAAIPSAELASSPPDPQPAPSTPPSATRTAAPHLTYPRWLPHSAAGMLVSGATLLVLAGIVATSLHRTPTVLVGKQSALQAPAAGAIVLPGGAAAPAPSPQRSIKSSAAIPLASVAATPAHRTPIFDDDDDAGAAAPYSTPIPGQVLAKPSAYGHSGISQTIARPPAASSQTAVASAQAPASRPPSNEIASAAAPATPASAPATALAAGYPAQSYAGGPPLYHQELRASYRDPDGALAGDLPRSSRGSRAVLSDHPAYLDVSSGVMAGNLISAPLPDYPMLARMAHVGGEVVLQAVIAKNGSVLATHVLRGNRLLRGAAEDAVRQWRYRPYAVDGHPVEVATIVTVRFRRR